MAHTQTIKALSNLVGLHWIYLITHTRILIAVITEDKAKIIKAMDCNNPARSAPLFAHFSIYL